MPETYDATTALCSPNFSSQALRRDANVRRVNTIDRFDPAPRRGGDGGLGIEVSRQTPDYFL